MDSRKRKAIMSDGMEVVVYISPDGHTCGVYTDDEEDAHYMGILEIEDGKLYGNIGGSWQRHEVGRLV